MELYDCHHLTYEVPDNGGSNRELSVRPFASFVAVGPAYRAHCKQDCFGVLRSCERK